MRPIPERLRHRVDDQGFVMKWRPKGYAPPHRRERRRTHHRKFPRLELKRTQEKDLREMCKIGRPSATKSAGNVDFDEFDGFAAAAAR